MWFSVWLFEYFLASLHQFSKMNQFQNEKTTFFKFSDFHITDSKIALIWMFIASEANRLRTFHFGIVVIVCDIFNRPQHFECKPFICRCFQDAQIISVSHIRHEWHKPHSVMLSEIACGWFELLRHKRGPCSHAQCTWTTISICIRARFGFHVR